MCLVGNDVVPAQKNPVENGRRASPRRLGDLDLEAADEPARSRSAEPGAEHGGQLAADGADRLGIASARHRGWRERHRRGRELLLAAREVMGLRPHGVALSATTWRQPVAA
jgi:hypothetical protein